MSPEGAERPKLAPATWLVGKLDESALRHPPFAVERAKLGYIQMGELAYHVAEHADGERTVDEIATAVSAALNRQVGVADVHALIHTVLVPRGVVTVQDDTYLPDEPVPDEGVSPEAPYRNGHGQAGRAGLSDRPVRERVIGPAPLERIASVLMWVFWPPIMLVLTGLALAALSWLFVLHGLAASVVEVLTVPVLLPIALLLTCLVICLEPLGPMAALYSAGARIERLRIARSLRHWSVVLEVADDYGLSRWARITVDLSGAYFQIVAALLLCVVGMGTGAEFLFLTTTLLALNAVRLLLPFGRPGADRLLADLLLVPEPLLYAGQVLERRLPGGRAAARLLPPLKRWGWATIWAYLLATGIALVLVGFVVLAATPTVVATILAALVAHVSDMLGAIGERDAVGFLGGLFQAGLLALVTFVLAVGAITVVGRSLMRLWAWGQTSSQRRLAVLTCASVGALLILLFWVPVPRFGTSASRTPRSLLGETFRPLSPITRGTIADLFLGTRVDDVTSDSPTVTNDIGTGVDQPVPGQATPGAATGGAPGSTTDGATGAAPAFTPSAPPPPTTVAGTPTSVNAQPALNTGAPASAPTSASAPEPTLIPAPPLRQQPAASPGTP